MSGLQRENAARRCQRALALFEMPEALRRRSASSGAPGGGAPFFLNRGGPQMTFSAMNIIQLYYTFQNVSLSQDCVNILLNFIE